MNKLCVKKSLKVVNLIKKEKKTKKQKYNYTSWGIK